MTIRHGLTPADVFDAQVHGGISEHNKMRASSRAIHRLPSVRVAASAPWASLQVAHVEHVGRVPDALTAERSNTTA